MTSRLLDESRRDTMAQFEISREITRYTKADGTKFTIFTKFEALYNGNQYSRDSSLGFKANLALHLDVLWWYNRSFEWIWAVFCEQKKICHVYERHFALNHIFSKRRILSPKAPKSRRQNLHLQNLKNVSSIFFILKFKDWLANTVHRDELSH